MLRKKLHFLAQDKLCKFKRKKKNSLYDSVLLFAVMTGSHFSLPGPYFLYSQKCYLLASRLMFFGSRAAKSLSISKYFTLSFPLDHFISHIQLVCCWFFFFSFFLLTVIKPEYV